MAAAELATSRLEALEWFCIESEARARATTRERAWHFVLRAGQKAAEQVMVTTVNSAK